MWRPGWTCRILCGRLPASSLSLLKAECGRLENLRLAASPQTRRAKEDYWKNNFTL
jgi:hypothetical protein